MAAEAGLQLGDVVVAVDDKSVVSMLDFEEMIKPSSGSKSFRVEFLRPAMPAAYSLDDLVSDARKLPWLLNWIQTSFEAHEANLMQVNNVEEDLLQLLFSINA